MKTTILLALAFLAAAAGGGAAADPDLVLLEAEVKVLGIQLGVIHTQLEVHLAQHEAAEPAVAANLAALGQARLRTLERLLLACAREPERCPAPGFLLGAEDPGCAPPDPRDPHDHGVFSCPLQELVKIVDRSLAGARRIGLDRDLDRSEGDLAAARDAFDLGDGAAAFRLLCSAYKSLACP